MSKEIEKEIRCEIDKTQIDNIKDITTPILHRQRTLDIVFGKAGFDSLEQFGYIGRVRQNDEGVNVQIKTRLNETEWEEESFPVSSISEGAKFFDERGDKPYLFIDRFREVRSYRDLKIFIDEVDMLGDFVEMEYQENANGFFQLGEFFAKADLMSDPVGLYGDLIKEKMESDAEFKAQFDAKLNEHINESVSSM